MTEGCEQIIQLLASWSGRLGSGKCAIPRAPQGMEPAGLLWTWHYTIAWLLSCQVPSSHFLTSFPEKTSSLITPTWLFVLESASVELTSDKAHCQMIEKPCKLFASKNKKRQSAFKLQKPIMQTSVFQEENLKEKKNIWRSSASPGSSQANMSAKPPMRSPRRMSNKSRSLWTVSMAAGSRQQALRAQGPPPDVS